MKKKVYFLSVLIFSSLLVSCSSTNGLKESDRPFSYINTNLTEKQLSSESYVFIRLYDISYDKALRPGNFLRGPIRILGKAGNGRYYVHSAVSHGLRVDSFVGLTLTDKKNNMARYESVMDITTNDFMATNDARRSTCAVLAIPCTKSENEYLKKVLEYLVLPDNRFVYGILHNAQVPISHFGNGNKIMKAYNFPIEYAFSSMIDVGREPESLFPKKSYVCSSFVAYILEQCVDRVNVSFLQSRCNSLGYTPVDLYYIEGSFVLFDCSYADYDKILGDFLDSYPQFKKFID